MAIEVNEWNGGKLTNGEFRDYSTEIVRIAGAFDTEKIPVADAVSELRTTNTTLADFINETRRSDKTATLVKLDNKRDILFRALYSAVNILAEADETTGVCANAKHLANVMSVYKGIHEHSLTRETDEIQGLQIDLEKTASVTSLKETGLYKIAGELFETNTQFKSAYSSRTDEKGAKEASKGGETTASLRKKAAALIVRIIHVVNALNAISSDAATTDAANKLAAIVKQYKLVAASHGKKKGSDPSPDPSPDPEPDPEPDEKPETAS